MLVQCSTSEAYNQANWFTLEKGKFDFKSLFFLFFFFLTIIIVACDFISNYATCIIAEILNMRHQLKRLLLVPLINKQTQRKLHHIKL